MTNTVTVPVNLGGTGTTYSDGTDAKGMKGVDGYGWKTNLFPMLSEVVAAAETVVTIASPVQGDLANINLVAADLGNVDLVAADLSHVNLVAADKTNIDLVAANIANINSLQTALGTPAAGQILIGNAGGTAYAPKTVSGHAALSSTGALTLNLAAAGALAAANNLSDIANPTTARTNLGLGPLATQGTVCTWATKPSAAAAGNGALIFVSDVGQYGTYYQSTGTRWRPLHGRADIRNLGGEVNGIGLTETIVMQALLQPGVPQVNDELRLWIATNGASSSVIPVMSVYVGPLGTAADPVINSLSGRYVMGSGSTGGGAVFGIKVVSNTAMKALGSTVQYSQGYTYAGSSPEATPTPVADITTTPLYVTVTIKASAAGSTVGIVKASLGIEAA